MKIIIDDKIPYINGAFEEIAEVVYLPGSKTTAEIVKDADAIITRTRTICNEKLLAGSNVKFIATATIGYDHIDTGYCEKAGIKWTNAPGCNSKSVEQYIASSLLYLAKTKNLALENLCIGVVGVGNVGSKVANICRLFGMRVLLNDPPRARKEKSIDFVALKKVMEEADIITLHVPLNMKGKDATFHLCDDQFFSGLNKKPVIINSCRGEVVNTEAIKIALQKGKISEFICDCWENEPDIDLELLNRTFIATPHIAGYSKDGKAKGTSMSVSSISKHFGLGIDDWQPKNIEAPVNETIEINGIGLSKQEILSKVILSTYDISIDDKLFRNETHNFEKLRGDYPVRREFPAFTVLSKNVNENTLEVIKKLGFKTTNKI